MSEHIQRLDEIETYAPPGHSGTTNHRLVSAAQTNGAFEMIHGRLEPGGHAEKHHHETEYQAFYVLSGAADVALGDEPPVRVEAGSVVRLPPGLDHEVTSLGPDDLELLLVYSPPLTRTE